MVGGDTDTISSMAGQMMGCVVGRGGIPDEMAVRVPCYDRVIDLASKLADIGNRV